MALVQPPRRLPRALALGIAAHVGLLLASVAVLAYRTDLRKLRPAAHPTTVALAVAPSVSVGFTACPGVTSPAAVVARFSIWLFPLVAFVVTVSRIRELTVARIGGLYGP